MRPRTSNPSYRPLSRVFGALSVAIGLIALAVACGGSNTATKEDRLCTPGNYVYCRCADRSEGTKLCNDDGQSFKPCVCEGTNGSSGDLPPYTEWDGGFEQIDSGPVDPGAPMIDVACKDRLGVVAGNGTSKDVYVATYKGGGVFQVSKSTGPSVLETPTIVNVGPALVASWQSVFSTAVWSKMQAGTWSPPVTVDPVTTTRPTAAASYAGGERLLYLDATGNLQNVKYDASGWTNASQPSAEATPTKKSELSATAPSDGTVLVAYTTDAGAVVTRSLSSAGNWLVPKTIVASGAFSGPAAVTAIEGSATEDALVVYVDDATAVLRAVARQTASKNWGSPMMVDNAALALEYQVAPLPGGKAMLVYLGSNDAPYVSVYTPGSGFAAPVEMFPGKNPPLAAAPTLTKGRCGSDVTAAYLDKGTGLVRIAQFTNGKWTGPYDVQGIPAATYVGVGETP